MIPRSAPSVVSAHHDSVERLERGRTTREMINPNTRSRDRHRGPNSAGNPSVRAIAPTAATCPWGSERLIREEFGGSY